MPWREDGAPLQDVWHSASGQLLCWVMPPNFLAMVGILEPALSARSAFCPPSPSTEHTMHEPHTQCTKPMLPKAIFASRSTLFTCCQGEETQG